MKTVLMFEFEQMLSHQILNILDVREKDEFLSGHISGAIFAPMSDFARILPTLVKEKTYYIVCNSGSRSLTVAKFLMAEGYQVVNVLGGMSSYGGKVVYDM